MLRSLARGALVAVPLLVAAPASAQILNTIGGWDQRDEDWTGRLAVTGSISGGNTDVKSASGSARVQWRGETWLARFLGNFRFEEANGLKAAEESVAHARVVRAGESRWQPVAFAQSQRNPFRRLETRILLGAGVQYVAWKSERYWMVFGATPMVEFEKIAGGDEATRGRSSFYVIWNAEAESGVTLSLQGFYQPRLSEPEDSRSSVSGSMSAPLVGPVSFLVSGGYEHDDDPPPDVRRDDWRAEFGVAVDL